MLFAGYLARRIIFSSPEERTNYLYINVLLCVRTHRENETFGRFAPNVPFYICACTRVEGSREICIKSLFESIQEEKKEGRKKEREKNEEETSTLVGITSREKYASNEISKERRR